MSQSSIPICNIRYCHRPPASWILAGFSLLEKDGLLKFDLVRDISYDKNGLERSHAMINFYRTVFISTII